MAECQLWGESLQVPPTPWGRACEHRPRETSCPQQSHQELLLSSAWSKVTTYEVEPWGLDHQNNQKLFQNIRHDMGGQSSQGRLVQTQNNPVLIDSLLRPGSSLPVTYYLTWIHKTYKFQQAKPCFPQS